MTEKPKTHCRDLAHLPPALLPLTQQKHWVLWRWEFRDGKWTKVPYQCSYYNTKARSNDPTTWGTYEAAIATFVANANIADGIAFMLLGSKVGAIDLDRVRDTSTGELADWVKNLCMEADDLGLYREVTVSGCGLRFIGLSQGDKLHHVIKLNGNKIELYRNCGRLITISGLQEGSCEALGPIGDYLETLFARRDSHSKPVEPNGGAFLDLNDARPQTDENYYWDLIINGAPKGGRGAKFQSVIWHLAANNWSIKQIVDVLAQHPNGIGSKYAGRLLAEVERSFEKWQDTRRAEAIRTNVVIGAVNGSNGSSTSSGTGSSTIGIAPTGVQIIRVVPSQLPRVIKEAEDALLTLDDEIYQRGSTVVRPVLDQSLKMSVRREADRWQLVEVTRPYLVVALCRAAEFQRYDKRAKKFVAIDAPDKVAEAYLNHRGGWRLPILIGIVNTPFLRVDGSICETVGYDVESRVLFKASEVFPPIPKFPDKCAATAALGKLRKLIESFPFVTNADRSVTLAGILTALDRKAMRSAPLIGFTAPAARTGKSLLVDLISMLATGRSMPVMSQGKTIEEFEKRLHAALLAGDACISIDNCEQTVTGDALCQALTQDEVNIRVLGLSRNVRTTTGATIFATGNNLIIGGDLTDRCLLASLDAGVERPGLRRFTVNILEEAHSRRAELVVAALTVLRAWHVARGQGVKIDVSPFGGFEDWSWRVREALIWLDEADPYDTVVKVQEKDPELDLRTAVMTQWQENIGVGSKSSIHDIIACAILVPAFYEALLRVAERGSSGTVSHERFGRWLKRVEGKILNDFKIVKVGTEHGYPIWSLVR